MARLTKPRNRKTGNVRTSAGIAEGAVSRAGILDRAVIKELYREIAMRVAKCSALIACGRRSIVSYVPSESGDIDLK
jgi:hypothetical protein